MNPNGTRMRQKEKLQKTFDDLYAVSEDAATRKHTAPPHLEQKVVVQEASQ